MIEAPNPHWTDVGRMDIDELANYGAYESTNIRNPVAHIAFVRLQTIELRKAAEAQIAAAADQRLAAQAAERAAIATAATAKSTADSAWWLMWSVIVLVISSAANAIIQLIGLVHSWK